MHIVAGGGITCGPTPAQPNPVVLAPSPSVAERYSRRFPSGAQSSSSSSVVDPLVSAQPPPPSRKRPLEPYETIAHRISKRRRPVVPETARRPMLLVGRSSSGRRVTRVDLGENSQLPD